MKNEPLYLHGLECEIAEMLDGKVEYSAEMIHEIALRVRQHFGQTVQADMYLVKPYVEHLSLGTIGYFKLRVCEILAELRYSIRSALSKNYRNAHLTLVQKIEQALLDSGIPQYEIIDHRLRFPMIQKAIYHAVDGSVDEANFSEVLRQVRYYLKKSRT